MSLKIESLSPSNQFIKTEAAQDSPLTRLFIELLRTTFSYVDKRDIGALSCSCKTLYRVTHAPDFWKLLFKRDFPCNFPFVAEPTSLWKVLYQKRNHFEIQTKKGNFKTETARNHVYSIKKIHCFNDNLITSSSTQICVSPANSLSTLIQEVGCSKIGTCFFSPKGSTLVWSSEKTLNIYTLATDGKYYSKQRLNSETPMGQLQISEDYLLYSCASQTHLLQKNGEGFFEEIRMFKGVFKSLISENHLFLITCEETIQIWKKEEKNFECIQPPIQREKTKARTAWMSFQNDHLFCGKVDGAIHIFKKNAEGIFAEYQSFKVCQLPNMITAFHADETTIYCGLQLGRLVIIKKQVDGVFVELAISEHFHKQKINAIESKEDCLLVGSTDGSVSIWKQSSSR